VVYKNLDHRKKKLEQIGWKAWQRILLQSCANDWNWN